MKLASLYVALCVAVITNPSRSFALDAINIADVTRTDLVSFEKEILPILRQNCLACHSATEKQGDLVLESPQEILKGGDSGPSIVSGKGQQSLILKAAAHLAEPFMPPTGNTLLVVEPIRLTCTTWRPASL